MTCRDWLSTLRPASYRGVPFQIERDAGEYGKRVQVHEYPNRETWYPEELGQKARYYRLTAYLASDTIDAELSALVTACTTPGSGTLMLPLEGPKRAICLTVKTNREKNKAGYLAVDMEFVEDPGVGPAPYPTRLFARRVLLSADTALRLIADGFAARYRTVDVPGFVIVTGAAVVRALASTIEAARSRLPISGEQAASIRQMAIDLYADADTLARAGSAGDLYSQTSWVRRQSESPAGLPGRIAEVLVALRTAAPVDAAGEALAEIAGFVSGVSLSAATPGRRREAENVAAIEAMARQTAIAEYAATLAGRTFASRREAVTARAEIVETIEAELGLARDSRDRHGVEAMTSVRDAIVEHLSRSIADLAPVVTVSTSVQMPAIYWSYRLYGDAGRAGELVSRNRVKHPGFMPAGFEALAR